MSEFAVLGKYGRFLIGGSEGLRREGWVSPIDFHIEMVRNSSVCNESV
eukprot:COSAG02_NODE_2983_length_7620_cov_73.890271_7_plen_48_part_00